MVAQIDGKYIRKRPLRLWCRLISYALFEGRPLTTRGQWINPLVFCLFRIQKRLPQLKKITAPIYILGAGRSGTTVLGVLLSMHPHVGFLNEPKALWHSALGGGEDLIGSFDKGPARYRLSKEDISPKAVTALHRIYGAYLRITGTCRVVDKYPELVFRIPMVKAIFPDSKFIFISRNGWDTCSSIEHWSARLGVQHSGEVHDWWGVDSRKWSFLVEQIVPEHADLAPYKSQMMEWKQQTDRAVVEWIVTMREGLNCVATDPHNFLHVPYEEMCSAPEIWMNRISVFAGFPTDKTFCKYARQKLSLAPPKLPFPLADCLKAPFNKTMESLGYT